MSWRDRYQRASFRGVEFYVGADDRPVGRRLVTHEYPRRDLPFTEDLGRATRYFRVTGYVIGENYLEQLDRLMTALDRGGPGQLVHPWYGSQLVHCDGHGSGISHNDREGGMARLALVFVEAGAQRNPGQRPDTGARLSTAAASLQATATSSAGVRLQLPI